MSALIKFKTDIILVTSGQARLHHNNYMCAKFQSNPFSGLSCGLIDPSVTVAFYVYK